MRFVILNTDYQFFLDRFYADNPTLKGAPYEKQMAARVETHFGLSDSISWHINQRGYEAVDIFMNNSILQRTWADENGIVSDCLDDILKAQIKLIKPDIIINFACDSKLSSALDDIRPNIKLLIGWGPPPLLKCLSIGLRKYDLMLAPSEGLVLKFRQLGLPSELFKLGFDDRVRLVPTLNTDDTPTIDITFAGSITSHHRRRKEFLLAVGRTFGDRFKMFGKVEGFGTRWRLRKWLQPPMWGLQYYSIIEKSKVSLNCHIDLAGAYADNMRLFEATGMGSCVITDWKSDIQDLFSTEEEIVTYKSVDEGIERIDYLLDNESERSLIASAGQRRTLNCHTYKDRIELLMRLIESYAK